MCLFARNEEPSLARYAQAAGISTISIILAVPGIVFLLSNRSVKKHFTDKRDRINDK